MLALLANKNKTVSLNIVEGRDFPPKILTLTSQIYHNSQITIPRKTYDGIRDGERTALQQLKAEQEKLKRLEFTITDLEQQCSSFTEKIRSTTEERNRYWGYLIH